jgi:hypothetical protein
MLWATRRGCHVDRTACVWLIRRFIDGEANFSFFEDPAEAPVEAELHEHRELDAEQDKGRSLGAAAQGGGGSRARGHEPPGCVSPILRTALQRALIPLIDATKTTGIIFLPGAMVGMIIAGADPLEAVRLQMVVLYMLLGSVAIAAILVGLLSYRSFFTARHQLRLAPLEK